MRARRARVVGVLLALAHLVAARPFGQSNASVVPFSQSSVEFARARRALTGYIMTDSNFRTAVTAWLSNRASAEATYGHISTWDTSGVTDMSWLFCGNSAYCGSHYKSGASSFNEDIGAWDTSGVTTMLYTFYGAWSFNRPIGDWWVDSVTTMAFMFQSCGFNQPLSGWNIDRVTSMRWMFRWAS